MIRDPIVEEIHRIRERMWDECGGNLDQLIETFRTSEAQHRDRIITPEKLREMRHQTRAPSDRPRPD